jgi:hypothetical protein
MLSNISDLFTMASLVVCMLLSGIIFYYLRTRISMLEQSVMDQAQLLQQVVASLKSSQYRQMNPHAAATIQSHHQQQHDAESNANQQQQQQQQQQLNLIQVSDDDDDDDDDTDTDTSGDSESDSDSDYEGEDERANRNGNGNGNTCTIGDNSSSCSKIIDLSSLTAGYYKPLSSQSEIKVIELTTSNIHLNHSDGGDDDASSASGSDDDDDHDDDDDDDDDDDEYSEDGDRVQDNNNAGQIKNDNNANQNKENNTGNGTNHKKIKSIIIEDNAAAAAESVSLDEMKNMPVNSLRSLAKTKLGPSINKMSKKDILKALHVHD